MTITSTSAQKRTQSELQITVVTIRNGLVWQRIVWMPSEATAQEALQASGFLSCFPEVSLADIVMGIYGKRVFGSHILTDHDRLELYAPLQVDPKIARRRRAAHREKTKNIKKKMPINDLTQP